MNNRITHWSPVAVILILVGILVGTVAFAQTDNPSLGQSPPAAPPTSELTVPAPGLQASPGGGLAGFRRDCAQDLQRLCYGVAPGEGRLIQCLLSHRGQLSPACMFRVAAAPPAPGVAGPATTGGGMKTSCGSDVQKLCVGVSRENGGVIKCLLSHRIELSLTCQAFLKEMRARRAAEKSAPSNNVPPAPQTTAPPDNGSAAAGAAANH